MIHFIPVVFERVGDQRACRELATRLGAIEGVEAKEMVFSHAR